MRVLQFIGLLIVCLAGAQSLALDPATQSTLIEALEDAAFADDKLEVLRPYSGKTFTAEQARAVIDAFAMSDDKLEALRLIASGIPKTAMGEVGKAFAFDDDRAEARRILQSSGSSGATSPAGAPGGKNRCANLAIWQTAGQSDGTMTTARFNEMGTTVKGESFSDSKVAALRSFLDVAPEGLKPSQVKAVIGWFSFRDDKLKALRSIEDRIIGLTSQEMKDLIGAYAFSDDKIKVLRIVKDTLLDLENRYAVVEAFTFDGDKKKARKLLASIEGRTYLWGTVRAKRPVFVLDTSGSMRESGRLPDGTEGSRLSFLQKEMSEVLMNHIAPTDQFEIITFSSGIAPLNRKLVAGTDKNRARASQAIASKSPNGGTNIHDALEAAFSMGGIDAVYLLTDGMPSAGRSTDTKRIREAVLGWNALKGIPLHTVALLTGRSGAKELEASRFMFELAQQNCGQFRLVK